MALSSELLLYSFSMKKKDNSSQKKNMFSILLYPFHSDSIEGLDVCHRKPLIVTCSKDHTIRIWNYRTFGIELAKVCISVFFLYRENLRIFLVIYIIDLLVHFNSDSA